MPSNRRQMMQRSLAVASLLAAAGAWPARVLAQAGWNKAAFEAKSVADVMKALGMAKPVESKDVVLNAPDIAENGAVVPVAASSALPGVKRILFLVEKNPNTLAGWFDFGDAVEAEVGTRIKMAETSKVYAVAMLADQRVLFASKDVKVTLGGCGG
jgi:sulfur-oxidizing protein SoxY